MLNDNDKTGMSQSAMPVMPVNPKLAHAYVPYQTFEAVFNPLEGLTKGTIFPGLDRPCGMDPEYLYDQ